MLGSGTYATDDVIAAIATPPGPAARAVVRLSGAEVRHCLEKIWRPAEFDPQSGLWEESQQEAEQALAVVSRPKLLPGWAKIDATDRSTECSLCYWPDARSFTRMPLAEIHLIGSDPLVKALLEQACQHGARLAQGGEFTLRAFLGGRIDLTQAEAVLGVIESQSEQEFDVALRQLAGGLSQPIHAVRDELLNLLSEVEAGLDFADEDILVIEDSILDRRLRRALEATRDFLSKLELRESAVPAGRVVLLGQPNAGKSSLFNRLTGGSALESPEPGTTRDYLASLLQLDDLQCELIDTAGVALANTNAGPQREEHAIDREARAMTATQTEQASLTVLCLDATQPLGFEELKSIKAHRKSGGLVVMTKCDLEKNETAELGVARQIDVRTSSLTGEGFEALRKLLRDRLANGSVAGQAVVSSTAARCRESVQMAAESLAEAVSVLQSGSSHELIAVEIRIALDALGQVSGAVYTEDMLDRIFSSFCIGK